MTQLILPGRGNCEDRSLSPDIGVLAVLARRLRGLVVDMSHRKGAPHLGGALSCVDILVAVYWTLLRVDPNQPNHPERDRFIMSKGHAAAAFYATLALRGFFPVEDLERYCQAGSPMLEHPTFHGIPGVEASTGSLGHGLSIGLGMALSARLRGLDYRVVVLMSDGECNEGSVWEAALFGAAQNANNLLAIVDYNKWQATGRSDDVLALAPLKQKWAAFGWHAVEIDGHDLAALARVIREFDEGTQKPMVVVAHTTKGKGVSFMEDDNNWHYRIPTAAQVALAHQELGVG